MTRDAAMLLLGFKPDDPEPLTEDEVRAAYRKAAMAHHPDHGGSEAEMARVNEARDVLLAELAPPKGARCVCTSPFKRNPLCKAKHEEAEAVAPPPPEPEDQGEPCVCRGFHRNPMCRARH